MSCAHKGQREQVSRNGRRHKDYRVEFSEPASTGFTEGSIDKNTKTTQDSNTQIDRSKRRMHKSLTGDSGENKNTQKIDRGKLRIANY